VPGGSGALTAVLPNGRVLWLRSEPPLAPSTAVTHLSELAEHSARWRRATNRAHGVRIDALSRVVSEDDVRLSDGIVARTRATRDRLEKSHVRLHRKLVKARKAYRGSVARQFRIEREAVRRLGRRDLWDQIVLATAGAVFAAYGERDKPFGTTNIALTLALLMWIVGDDIVDAIFGPKDTFSPYPINDTDTWSYLAPIGFVLTAWWLMHDRQNERFVTGVQPLRAKDMLNERQGGIVTATAAVTISGIVKPGLELDFENYQDVPAVATIAALEFTADGIKLGARLVSATAKVVNGELQLVATVETTVALGLGDPTPDVVSVLDLAWMVDTAKPVPIVA